jgi:HAD superfamily hydrolase (TIGR01484 family)
MPSNVILDRVRRRRTPSCHLDRSPPKDGAERSRASQNRQPSTRSIAPLPRTGEGSGVRPFATALQPTHALDSVARGLTRPYAKPMRYLALCADYDGTIARDGRVPDDVVDALKGVGASGRKLILVTGREFDDLVEHFPDVDIFDAVVAENGAVLYDPSFKEETLLAEPPPREFVEVLRQRGVGDLRVGRSIVATWVPNDAVVLEVIREMGLEWHIIFNKGAVMALPSSVNKATGLTAALERLRFSPHNAVGIGDAENDHAFLSICECSVAVANAIDTVKERADYVTRADHGRGVMELTEMLVEDDLRVLEPRLTRRHILLGEDSEGDEVRLPPWDISLMFAGSSGGGKSTAAAGFLERLAEAGYQYCIIDPEGEWREFGDSVPLGSKDHIPRVDEIIEVLDNPGRNVVVSLHGVALQERPFFLVSLLPRLQELRSTTGRPHWIVIDEAHHVVPRDWDPAAQTIPQGLRGLLFVTVHPDLMAPAALQTITTLVILGKTPEQSIEAFAKTVGEPPPVIGPTELEPGGGLVWDRNDRSVKRVKVQPAQQQLKRHTRKYAEGDLGRERSFYFTGPENKMHLQAQNLMLFSQIGEGVDDETWMHHARRHDYSAWFRDEIKDPDLADRVHAIESDESLSTAESRARIREAIEQDYTLPASHATGWQSDEASH